jgi:hypothetical protein
MAASSTEVTGYGPCLEHLVRYRSNSDTKIETRFSKGIQRVRASPRIKRHGRCLPENTPASHRADYNGGRGVGFRWETVVSASSLNRSRSDREQEEQGFSDTTENDESYRPEVPPELDRPLFQHRPWMAGIVLVFAFAAIVAGLTNPVWLLIGSPFILALVLYIGVRLTARKR